MDANQLIFGTGVSSSKDYDGLLNVARATKATPARFSLPGFSPIMTSLYAPVFPADPLGFRKYYLLGISHQR